MNERWLARLAATLPRHAGLVGRLRDAVLADDRLRWFDVSCSLGSERGDDLSDIDGAIGYAEHLDMEEVEQLGRTLVAGVGAGAGGVVDVLVHQLEGWQPESRRFAAEYVDGLQLDLVMLPSPWMKGLRDGEMAIVDKDGNLAGPTTSAMYGPPDHSLTREWVLMGWWWLSDVAKYLHRGAHFEAAERIALVRQQALRLFAAARGVPYPAFGLTSLLDYPPFELPEGLAETYSRADDRMSLVVAATAAADLLEACSARAEVALGHDLSTGWSTNARARLDAATLAPFE